jgi:hypothetical protein
VKGVLEFQCTKCDQWHKGAPSFGFQSPHHYGVLSDHSKASYASLDSDFCIINHPDSDGPQFFIRCILEVPIHGLDEPFLWGAWSSLSEKSFRDYEQRFKTNDVEDISYFGYFCNILPFYPDTLHLKCRVIPQAENNRPLLELEPTDHPLVKDFTSGIAVDRAIDIFEACQHNS